MASDSSSKLLNVHDLASLIEYLRDELHWPIAEGEVDDVTFGYEPHEVGLKEDLAPKVNKIYQLRKMHGNQPWGVFYIDFESKSLPITVMRRILSHLVVKRRQTGSAAHRAAWEAGDLLFITTFGASGEREIAFARFQEQAGDLPTLKVLGWDGGDTPLKLDHVSRTLHQDLSWPRDVTDLAAWRKQWQHPFRHRLGHVIRTADRLAERLAELARDIRDRCRVAMAVETESGPLTRLYTAFQTALLHDLKSEDFADTYAQTITYGLLTAAISRTDMQGGANGTALLAEDVAQMVPITNPFLKEMLESFLRIGGRRGGIDFDELGVQEVVELLRGDETDLPAIVRDFGNRKPGEDPVIHFYEHFLAAYDKKLKIKRGIFYTPLPVVSYIVRSVHELLKTEFGLEDGLASTVTWGEMAERNREIRIPEGTDPDSHFVVILDPAVGTATFLVEVIDVIYRTLQQKWTKQGLNKTEQSKDWNVYVPDHLLPRLFGYEIMMAPYAIAHMKIGLKLTETGYKFLSDGRVCVYLTNALEPPQPVQPSLPILAPALAHEAEAVIKVKRVQRFTVVIGNPPYSGNSANAAKDDKGNPCFIGALVHDYFSVDGAPLGEKNPKMLQDDYVKFLRFGQNLIQQAGVGALGFITNHGYLDNPTFRGMRQSLMRCFDDLHFLDLHGNTKKKEVSPDGSKDENVFDIQQGVAVCQLVRQGKSVRSGRVCSADLQGLRADKYRQLSVVPLVGNVWRILAPNKPFYLFVPQDQTGREEYELGWTVTSIFPTNSSGIVTGRDQLCIQFTEADLWQLVNRFSSLPPEDARIQYELGLDSQDWKVEAAQKDIKESGPTKDRIAGILYRPFDHRYTYFTGRSGGLIQRSRSEVMRHMLAGPNQGLHVVRQISAGSWRHVLAARGLVDRDCVSNLTSERGYLHPLYRYADEKAMGLSREPNLNPRFLAVLATVTGLQMQGAMNRSTEGNGTFVEGCFSPEDVFNYIYGVLYSPTYRSRYAEFLKIDFPRIPLPCGPEIFYAIAALGSELVGLHLIESPRLSTPMATFTGPPEPRIDKVSYAHETVWIDRRQTIGFQGVPENVWDFHIGSYQVCEKWLKDRGPKKGNPGCVLTADDIEHYHKIVVALNETIRIMCEIDEVIDQHGGWPGAFAASERNV